MPGARKKKRPVPKVSLKVYCLCREAYDGSEFMIACDGCEEWFHGRCIGLTAKSAEHISSYYCPPCAKTNQLIMSSSAADLEIDTTSDISSITEFSTTTRWQDHDSAILDNCTDVILDQGIDTAIDNSTTLIPSLLPIHTSHESLPNSIELNVSVSPAIITPSPARLIEAMARKGLRDSNTNTSKSGQRAFAHMATVNFSSSEEELEVQANSSSADETDSEQESEDEVMSDADGCLRVPQQHQRIKSSATNTPKSTTKALVEERPKWRTRRRTASSLSEATREDDNSESNTRRSIANRPVRWESLRKSVRPRSRSRSLWSPTYRPDNENEDVFTETEFRKLRERKTAHGMPTKGLAISSSLLPSLSDGDDNDGQDENSYNVDMDMDMGEDDICPVCDSECTCLLSSNAATPIPEAAPPLTIKIKLSPPYPSENFSNEDTMILLMNKPGKSNPKATRKRIVKTPQERRAKSAIGSRTSVLAAQDENSVEKRTTSMQNLPRLGPDSTFIGNNPVSQSTLTVAQFDSDGERKGVQSNLSRYRKRIPARRKKDHRVTMAACMRDVTDLDGRPNDLSVYDDEALSLSDNTTTSSDDDICHSLRNVLNVKDLVREPSWLTHCKVSSSSDSELDVTADEEEEGSDGGDISFRWSTDDDEEDDDNESDDQLNDNGLPEEYANYQDTTNHDFKSWLTPNRATGQLNLVPIELNSGNTKLQSFVEGVVRSSPVVVKNAVEFGDLSPFRETSRNRKSVLGQVDTNGIQTKSTTNATINSNFLRTTLGALKELGFLNVLKMKEEPKEEPLDHRIPMLTSNSLHSLNNDGMSRTRKISATTPQARLTQLVSYLASSSPNFIANSKNVITQELPPVNTITPTISLDDIVNTKLYSSTEDSSATESEDDQQQQQQQQHTLPLLSKQTTAVITSNGGGVKSYTVQPPPPPVMLKRTSISHLSSQRTLPNSGSGVNRSNTTGFGMSYQSIKRKRTISSTSNRVQEHKDDMSKKHLRALLRFDKIPIGTFRRARKVSHTFISANALKGHGHTDRAMNMTLFDSTQRYTSHHKHNNFLSLSPTPTPSLSPSLFIDGENPISQDFDDILDGNMQGLDSIWLKLDGHDEDTNHNNTSPEMNHFLSMGVHRGELSSNL